MNIDVPKVHDNEKDKKFSGILSDEYELVQKAVPHYETFQNTVRDAICAYIQQLPPEMKPLRVLEAGCGTGITTARILNADPRIQVLAVDNEEKMISQAREAFENMLSRVQFEEADILEFLESQPDASWDVIASAHVLHNIESAKREEIFKHISRVLKAGGLFVNADKYARNDEQEHAQDLKNQIEAFDIFLSPDIDRPDLRDEWTKHYLDDEKVKITEGEQKRILDELGFENIEVIFREGMEATITAIKKDKT